jgi:hypothetical protein
MFGLRRLKGATGIFAICCAISAAVAATDPVHPRTDPADPIRSFIPGKWYEQQAQDYLKTKDYPAALVSFQKAAYWANKTAQYNIGIIYLKGMQGIGADPVRAVAWLGIAAEQHKPDVDKTLHDAYVALTPEQNAAASTLWKQLNADYGDAVTLPRATKRFNAQLASEHGTLATTETDESATTSRIDGYNKSSPSVTTQQLIQNLNTTGARNQGSTIASYVDNYKQQFADYVTAQFGHVDVGPVETLPEAH